MILEEMKNIKSDCKELKKFGLQVGIVVLILGVILSLFGNALSPIFLSIGGALILTGYYVPPVLLPLQKVWMTFSVLMGFVMTRVILAILFYFVITPISFLSKLFKKDFLNLKIEKGKKSYWNLRDEEYKQSSTEKQF